jgi:hypothetical protein
MQQNGIIARKLELVADRTAKLHAKLPLTSAQIAADYFLKSAIERFAREVREHA